MKDQNKFYCFLAAVGVVLCLPFAAWAITCYVLTIQFDQNCESYLENAAHANQIEQATPELDHAVAYLEQHGLTSGYTSIVYRTEDENVGFWFENLKAADKDLHSFYDGGGVLGSELEKSNVLLKLDNSLKSSASGAIRVPEGIAYYPHNTGMMVWGIISAIIGGIGALTAFVSLNILFGSN